jgi:polyphenol oxidase
MPANAARFIHPDWPAPPGVTALMSTRQGGTGVAPFDTFSLKLDARDPAAPANRTQWADALGAPPVWLRQVHGAEVAVLAAADLGTHPTADASVTREPGLACTVMVADCLPVLFCTADGRAVGAAHAGWRGLAAAVLENTVAALCGLVAATPADVLAWLGPCIGPRQFEVGLDVLQAFGEAADAPSSRFVRRDRPDGQARWLADLPGLARDRLQQAGVTRISGGAWCTVEDASRFFSFRRDRAGGAYGSLAAGITLGRVVR